MEILVNFVLPLLLVGANAGVSYIIWTLKQRDKHKDYADKALVVLLRRDLREMYYSLKNKQTISAEDFNDFEEIYQVYHALGGNGSGTSMYEKIKEKSIQ